MLIINAVAANVRNPNFPMVVFDSSWKTFQKYHLVLPILHSISMALDCPAIRLPRCRGGGERRRPRRGIDEMLASIIGVYSITMITPFIMYL